MKNIDQRKMKVYITYLYIIIIWYPKTYIKFHKFRKFHLGPLIRDDDLRKNLTKKFPSSTIDNKMIKIAFNISVFVAGYPG